MIRRLAARALHELRIRLACASILLLASAAVVLAFLIGSPRIPGAIELLESSLYSGSLATRRCQQNPFSSPGYLNASSLDESQNRWIPFAPNCSTASLLPSVQLREPISWLEGRTIVLFGSPVDRNHLIHFCELVMGALEYIEPSHPWSPVHLPAEFRQPGHVYHKGAQPHLCRVKEYRLQILFVFHYGMEVGDHWATFGRPSETLQHHWTPPGRFEDRLTELLLPMLGHIDVDKENIDLLEVSSYEWDLAYWQQVSAMRQKGPEIHLQNGWDVHLPFFLRRLAEVADFLLHTFPRRRAKILWRVPHVTGREDPAPRYAAAMEQATRFIFAESNATLQRCFELDETGAMLRGGGRSVWMYDHTHPAKFPHAVVWSDYILWQLRRSVTGEV